MPTDYPGTILDADSVWAAVYIYDADLGFMKKRNEIYILWALFTNDPYMPVLPLVSKQEMGFWDTITKRLPNDFKDILSKMCKNIKYPICTVEAFESTLDTEASIKGRVSKKFVNEQLYDAKSGFGLFDPDTISCEISGLSQDILAENGYEVY